MKSYLDMLNTILSDGESHHDRTGIGTMSIFGYQLKHDLRNGFPLLTTKKMFISGIVHELIWFLSGRTDNQWLNENGVKIWDEWATTEQCAKFGRQEGDLGPIYSHSWRAFGQEYRGPRGWLKDGLPITYSDSGDQIKSLIYNIQHNSQSRRLIVNSWNPLEATKVALPPCHSWFQCKIVEKSDVKYLDLMMTQRSQDAFLGGPFNIASYALLNHLISHVCRLIPRNLIISIGDLHIYNNHSDQIREQLSRNVYELPTILINERLRGGGFEALMDFKYSDIIIRNYQHHAPIKAPVAV